VRRRIGESWRDRWLAWRDRLLANPSFRRWAATFPLTRGVARRRAARVFDLVAGFVYSQVLVACVRLRLFAILAEGPQKLEALAPRLGLDIAAAERLLSAAVALELAEHRAGGRFGLGPLGAPMVGNPGVAAMVEHHALLYADLADPVALLRGESAQPHLARYWPYAATGEAQASSAAGVAGYSQLMSASQPLVAEEILAAIPLRERICLLDVGGGEGTFLVSAARRVPGLRMMLFDLPAVADRARQKLAAEGLAARVQVVAGSFHDDPLPLGADIATLIRVLHDHDDAGALHLLRAVHAALPPGGMLVVAEPMAQTVGAEAMGDAYFGFYLLAMGRGRPRSAERITGMLHEAGFVAVRRRSTAMPLQVRLITAVRPSAKTPVAKT
jgi:demethylspheroidene O-methyltransferase